MKDVVGMKLQKNRKIIFILIIAIIFLNLASITVRADWSTQELREIDQAVINAKDQATAMSKESLQQTIENLEQQINSKQGDTQYNASLQKAIDERVLSAYRVVYQNKTGTTYENNRPMTNPITDPILNPSTYDPTNSSPSTHKTASIIGVLVGAVRVVGTVVAIVAIAILGIKYMLGSTENKAKYKETMVPYVIGVIMLVATVNILGMLYNIFSNM